MRYDYSLVEDGESFVSVPEGNYLCRIAEVRRGKSRCGSERWSLRLEVADGEYAGRTAAWDSLTWSDRGVLRVKLVLGALGFEVDGVLELEPEDLDGLRAWVELLPAVWEDPLTGRRQERMSVPFAGWSSGGPQVAGDDADCDDADCGVDGKPRTGEPHGDGDRSLDLVEF